jgi:hypothetical protein
MSSGHAMIFPFRHSDADTCLLRQAHNVAFHHARSPVGTYAEMKQCRECRHQVSDQALACPSCGAPYPARAEWDGWGFEYKSKARLLGLPLLHVSFKYRANRVPVPAVGVISIGQFGAGIINVSQIGIGIISISQFTVAAYAVAQFALAYACIAQFGIYVDWGVGQFVRSAAHLWGSL